MFTNDMDPSSITQILAEESIYKLIKILAHELSKERNKNQVSLGIEKSKDISHFKIYEALLASRTSSKLNDDEDLCFKLTCCVQHIHFQDKEILHHFSECLKKLQEYTSYYEILRFLRKLTNFQPQVQKTKATAWHGKMFYCPPEMLDGSLFDQEPNRNKNEKADILVDHFNLLPGSNMPKARRFFQHHGIEIDIEIDEGEKPKSLLREQDQGYNSPPEIDWLEVAKMGPVSTYRTWETLGDIMPDPELPLLSESGLAACRQRGTVSPEQLQQDLTFLAVGISSKCFSYNKEKCKFEMVPHLSVSGLSKSIMEKLVAPMLTCGDHHRKLEEFIVSEDMEKGMLFKALQQGVRRFLVLHSEATRRVLLEHNLGISQLVANMRWLAPPLSSVAHLCSDSQSLSDIDLLEQLCSRACVLPPGRAACVLYSLLRNVTSAYFRILGNWLFEGEVDADGAREFFVQLQPGLLQLRTRQFWTQGFVLLEGRVPRFMHGLEDALMQCGKAVCLLKLCNPKEPLVCELRGERPGLECCLQPSELADLQNEWEAYAARAHHVFGPPVSLASELEHSKEQQQAFINMVARVQQERLKQIRATQQAEREAKWQAQQKLRAELRQQMGEVRARKAELQRQEQEEEEQRKLFLVAQQAEDDRRVAEEREKVLAHYKELSAASERRLEKAERKIQRLKNQLCQGGADENSNPINQPEKITAEPMSVTADSNANLPLQGTRSVPTSLVLNTPDQVKNLKNANENEQTQAMSEATANYKVASSEAAKNKTRVLSQEMNLITYCKENAKHTNDLDQTRTKPKEQEVPMQISYVARQEATRNKARTMQQEWNIITNKECTNNALDNKDSTANKLDNNKKHASEAPVEQITSPISENIVSPTTSSSSDGVSSEQANENMTPQCTIMTASMESAKSLKTEVDTPTGTYPSAMSISMETSSLGIPQSPCSAVTSSAMTDSKVTFAETPSDVPKKQLPTSVSSSSHLSVLSALSEPFKWPKSRNKENLNTALKKLDISTSHISHLLHQTVTVVLSIQLHLVNQSILKLFLQDEHLLSHFHSLRQYFLLVDGEFSRNITESLCHGLKEHAKSPRGLLNFVSIDSILRHALSTSVHGAKDCNANRLSLAIKVEPSEFKLVDPAALNCLQLQYQVAWPLCLILTTDALFQYDRIFAFLLGLRRGLWAVDECFQYLQQPPSNINPRLLSKSSDYHQLRLFRHEMGNFVQAFHYYIMNVAILRCWSNFKNTLKKATTLDELYKSHAAFIKRVIFFCLLRQEASDVQKLLQALLKIVLKFHRQLTSHAWQSRNNEYRHPAMGTLAATFSQFKERTRVLLRHMTKIADRGYQKELYELLHALNMNEYYNLNLQ